MDALLDKLDAEHEHILMNQEMTNRILATRVELDAELGQLKKKYASDIKEMEWKLKAEQEAHDRDLAARNHDLVKARDELNRLHQQMTEVEDELGQKLKAEKDAHEQDLVNARNELVRLHRQMTDEHEKVLAAQEMAGRMLKKRVESDGELSMLQRKYQNDIKAWEKRLQQELAARDKQAAEFKAELEKMKEEISEMDSQRHDLGSLLQQAVKVMFAMN
jgi:chromosome segregation ATPase